METCFQSSDEYVRESAASLFAELTLWRNNAGGTNISSIGNATPHPSYSNKFSYATCLAARSVTLLSSSSTTLWSPFSLRLGHRTALTLLTSFTTVLPLRYPSLWKAFSLYQKSRVFCKQKICSLAAYKRA